MDISNKEYYEQDHEEDYHEQEYIEINLPSNHKAVNSFAMLNEKDKLRCIELGYLFLTKGNEKIQYLNNAQWEEKIETLKNTGEHELCQLKNKYKNEIDELKEQIKREMITRENMYQSFNKEKQLLIEDIRVNEKNKYESDIDHLKTINKELEDKLVGYFTNSENKSMELHSFYDKKIGNEREKYESKIGEMNEKIESYREKIESLQHRHQNSTLKGQDGEKETFHSLNLLFPKAEITDCRNDATKGDFCILEGNINMMVEVKNYNSNVNKTEIEKFHRDMKKNTEYTCGVLMSLHTGICNKEDFSLEIINERPVIYIHNFNEDKNRLKYAFNMFKLIISIENLDLKNQEVIETVMIKQKEMKKQYASIKRTIEKFKKDILTQVETHEESTKCIFNLIASKNL